MLDLHNNRYLLSELLEPPAGYAFSYALATTYSLDLNTLLTVPLKLLRGGEADPRTNDVGLPMLQALREQGKQLRVFCQHGRILFPQVSHPLLCWLEEVVIQVPPPPGGSFHPKLWVVRYEEREGNGIIYRCLVGSRNLTYDQSADVMASIDGKVGETSQLKAAPLASFFSDLCSRFNPNDDHAEFLEGLSHTIFSTGGQFSDFNFIISRLGKPTDWFPEQVVGGLIISPFLSNPTVEWMLEKRRYKNEKIKLVSRKNELAKLSGENLKQLEAYHLKEAALAEFADPELDDDLANGLTGPSTSPAPAGPPGTSDAPAPVHDIHAKLYALTTSDANHIYLGSANATSRAHTGKNVEAMLQLTGSQNRMNRYSLADAMGLDQPDSLFQPYLFQPGAKPPEDVIANSLDAARDELASHLELSTNLRGQLTETEGYHRLTITVDLTACPPPSTGITTSARYLYRPAVTIPLHYGKANTAQIERLNTTEVSRWLVFDVIHTASKERRQFLLLVDYTVPENRDDLILSGMFKNQKAFFGYLHLLLTDQELMDWSEAEGSETGKLFGDGVSWGNAAVPLFEDLARQFALAPEKLRRVDDFISLLECDKRIAELQLEEFIELWHVFRAATDQSANQ